MSTLKRSSHFGDVSQDLATFVWELSNFRDVIQSIQPGIYMASSVFTVQTVIPTHWRLSIIPYPRGPASDYVSVYVHPLDDDWSYFSTMSLRLCDRDQQARDDCAYDLENISKLYTGRWYGAPKFVLRRKLLEDDQLLQLNGSLKIICWLRVYVPVVTLTGHSYESSPQFSDCWLIHSDRIVAAHRDILSSKSPVFARSLNGTGNGKPVVKISKEIDTVVFEELIRYIYSDKTPSSKFCDRLLGVAIKYGMEELAKICVGSLMRNMNHKNAETCLKLAEQYNLRSMADQARQVLEPQNKKLLYGDQKLERKKRKLEDSMETRYNYEKERCWYLYQAGRAETPPQWQNDRYPDTTESPSRKLQKIAGPSKPIEYTDCSCAQDYGNLCSYCVEYYSKLKLLMNSKSNNRDARSESSKYTGRSKEPSSPEGSDSSEKSEEPKVRLYGECTCADDVDIRCSYCDRFYSHLSRLLRKNVS